MKKYAPSVWNLTLIALVFVLTTSTFAAFAWADIAYTWEGSAAIPGTVLTIPAPNLLQTAISGSSTWDGLSYGGSYPGSGAQGFSAMNDGSFGTADKTGSGACTVNDNATATYTLDTSVNTLGYNISQIDVFTGWDGGRCVPNVTVLYSTISNSTFTSIGTAYQTEANRPDNGGDAFYSSDSRLTGAGGASLGLTGVNAIRFQFGAQQNGWVVYRELAALGTPTTTPEPSAALLLVTGLFCLVAYAWRKRK